ncbi:hypothetical protein HYPSUDRAFT_210323 [Hypholoma sublateritium FD-334 SS-4]|uniref:Uncharacterized protein n=1 Tax=Hypholoma sublateritium (strain FD-334 SS-4) TaxID=945553 RepID=A0A0D2N086_HYPSF|nr:hypothetical protein HYPSUDRAFT_210323 [Hypholoma sublateritium FD-334 SS-4]
MDQDHPKKYLNREELAEEITQKFKGMVESLGQELVQYGAVADIQARFRGTLHCEASLASLLDPQTRQSLAGNSDLQAVLDCTKAGLRAHHWNIEASLSCVSALPIPVITRRAFHHTKLSRHLYGLHPTDMDS